MAVEIDYASLMALASDGLLAIGSIGAAFYCYILSRRLKKFNTLENGVGGAVAVLSVQVDDMTRTLDKARNAAAHSSSTLTSLTERAEESARKLELMLASLHDLPDSAVDASEFVSDQAWQDTEKSLAQDDIPLFSTHRQADEKKTA